MNTEELMKLADDYAYKKALIYADVGKSKRVPLPVLVRSTDEARAALEAALSAKHGEQEAVKAFAASQELLPADMAKVLHDNLWDLYIKDPAPVNQQEPCDMGEMCLDCQPRGPNGECPDKAKQEPRLWQEGDDLTIAWLAGYGKAQERISELEALNERLWVALKGYHSNSAKQDWPNDIWIAAEVALREAAIAAAEGKV